jgi:hypothetical protein
MGMAVMTDDLAEIDRALLLQARYVLLNLHRQRSRDGETGYLKMAQACERAADTLTRG